MYTLKLKHHFDAAHNLKHYEGACANLHGHRWNVDVEITCPTLVNDMVIDFKSLKSVINQLDHAYLNNLVDFNPTAENISKYLYDLIDKEIAGSDSKIKVTIWESPEASITYTED